MQHNKPAKGFTLIEILIVIVVLTALAALLFPAFSAAREKSRRASCASNLRQMGLSVQQYTADYNSFPRPITGTAPTISWPTTLQPYVKNTQVFVCSSGEEKLTKVAVVADDDVPYCGNVEGDGSTDSVQLVPRLSYAWNAIPAGVVNAWVDPTWNDVVRPKSGFVVPKGRRLSVASVRDPVGTILIVDAWAGADDAINCDDGTLSNSIRTINAEARTDRYGNNTRSKVANRHNGGFNALFGDGHVKWQKWNTTTAGQWSIQAD